MEDARQIQANRDREYDKAYREWLATLSPKERARMVELGLDKPSCSYAGNGRRHDISELPVAAPAETDENDYESESLVAAREAGELLKGFLFRIIEERRSPRLEAECISLAFGFGAASGLTQTAVAKRYGVTRAAVSKRVREIKEAFNLPASEFMKSDRARSVYALTNRARS
jgi:L-cysteine desulfidase